MTTPMALGLSRVTVAAPRRRLDVALPDGVLVAELLPHLLRHAGEELADEGERHGGWALRRATGTTLEMTRSLAAQGVRDGEVLHLAPRRMDWPELAYDDVVEVIAGSARRSGRSWGYPATRTTGLAVTVGILALGAAGAAAAGPPWPLPGALALGLGLLLLVVGLVLARAGGDAVAGAAPGGAGLLYVFLGGLLVTVPADTGLAGVGAPHLLLGSATLIAGSVLGYVGIAGVPRIFTAGIAAGIAGALGAGFALLGMSGTGAAALTLVVALGLLPGYPMIAAGLGKLPMPALPLRPEQILEDLPVPERSGVFAAVWRANELRSGLLLAVGTVSVLCLALLVRAGGATATVLILDACVALLLRGRLFPVPRQRIPLLAASVAGLAALAVVTGLRGDGATRLAVLVVLLVAAGLVLAAGLVYSHRAPSPYVGRFADIMDVLAIMALLPLAAGVLGAYQAIQNMMSSVI